MPKLYRIIQVDGEQSKLLKYVIAPTKDKAEDWKTTNLSIPEAEKANMEFVEDISVEEASFMQHKLRPETVLLTA